MALKRVSIHPLIKERLGLPVDMDDLELLRTWKRKATRACKPCWELKYCPYGPLVEQFPLLPPTLESAKEHYDYAKRCLETGKVGSQEPLSAEERNELEECVKHFDPNNYKPDLDGELTAIQLVGHGKGTELTRQAAIHVNEQMKRSLATGIAGHSGDITEKQRAMFEEEVSHFKESDYPKKIPSVIAAMQCTVFGHICPVVYSAERITETIELRRTGRYISFKTKMRVVRRDNYTCQYCGKHLLDNEVEFDHEIPISKGGSSEEHNIRLTCFDCNREKSDAVEI